MIIVLHLVYKGVIGKKSRLIFVRTKGDLSPFYGRFDIVKFLDWEMKVENKF